MSDNFHPEKDDLKIEGMEEMAPELPEFPSLPLDPEKFTPLVGEKVKLTKQDYKDHQKAWIIVDSWESNPAIGNILNAADLNNIGCAYAWLREPKYVKAKEMFLKAKEKAPHDEDILANLDLLS
jgi:hypothetical protein